MCLWIWSSCLCSLEASQNSQTAYIPFYQGQHWLGISWKDWVHVSSTRNLSIVEESGWVIVRFIS